MQLHTRPPHRNPTMSRILFSALFILSLTTLTACESTGPKYRNVRSYSEGLAPVQTPGGRWGFVNERQEWVIQPKFEDAREFQGGKAAVRQNGKWGFINKRGEWL
ncbi:MAG: WG repeat-containing protein [Rhodocyclaceae bacterium]|nr:WG repeat-containing protein [Rhodocyclaceae bacterium]